MKFKTENRIKIARSFGSASHSYDVSARLQRFTGKNLMPWLPKERELTVLDLGAGTGFFTEILAGSYQNVIGLDISKQMLNFAKNNRSNNISWLMADAHKLPFPDACFDLIYSNLVIQWCDPLDVVLNEVLRVLKPGGTFVFTSLVDGTLFELKSAWSQVDSDQHVIDFKTQAQLIDLFSSTSAALVTHKCQNVVLEYENVLHLAKELKGIGASHVPGQKNKGLAGKEKWFKMIAAYQDHLESDNIYPATYCVFSGKMVKNYA